MTEQTAIIAQVRRYFELLTAGDTAKIIELFAADGTVQSPFLGTMDAAAFFEKLSSASAASKLTVKDVLIGESGQSAAARFHYDWTLATGDLVEFEGVDHFTLAADGRFQSMSIFYDTHPLRQDVGDKYANA